MVKLNKLTPYETIEFKADGFQLQGILHLPETKNPPVIIGSHGLLSSKSSPKQIELAHRCTENGIGFFRFDHKGCGDSQGKFIDVTTLESRRKDLISAINTIESMGVEPNRIGLFGSSMGGATCLSLAETRIFEAIVVYGAPVRISNRIEVPKLGRVSIQSGSGGKTMSTKNAMRLEFDISSHLRGIRNLLIMHGDSDETVPFAHAREIFEKVDEPKKLIPLKNGDHLLSDESNQDLFMNETVRWFKNYFKA